MLRIRGDVFFNHKSRNIVKLLFIQNERLGNSAIRCNFTPTFKTNIMSVEVNNITKLFGEQKALDQVSFSVKTGEIVGLLGPNGAGKSTLMKILTCFIPQSSGTASVCGYDVVDQSLNVRKNIGYLPENNPLYPDMYVQEFLEFAAGIYNLGNKTIERVEEMIKITGLQAERNKKIGQLSKGYRQRVGLAQALIHNPEVLILDEPTSGLDPNQLLDIRNLIKSISKEKTIILSTHIMQEVEAICDRVIIINQGKIVADDTTKDISNVSLNKTIITVEFDKVIDSALLKAINGVKAVKVIGENTWEIETGIKVDIRQDIFKFAVDHKLAVLTIHKEEERLEKVFQKLTRKTK